MARTGKVYLVGAGPGDPGLLTVKALEVLQSVEAVVYDRLVSAGVLERIPDGVTRIDVGKASGNHNLPQDEINGLLVRLASAGRSVARLKGGDPFVFGRGSEEAIHLRRHGIAFEVVPGVTAASACSAYAGVPLTHRGLSRSVQFVTGHVRDGDRLDLDWRTLADPQGTLVVYMGLTALRKICNGLMRQGMDPATPAVAIQDGTTAVQRRVFGDLATLPQRVQSSRLEAPVLVVIGRTVALAGELDWFHPTRDAKDRPAAFASAP